MAKILVNDGIETSGKVMLEAAGFEVDMNKIPQEELVNKLNDYDVICVRSATKVRKEQIDAAPNLKIIARGGVGLDNIDVDYAKSKGIHVINTPAASSRSVAEMAFAHIFAIARFLNKSNQEMPTTGDTNFNDLKKAYAKGIELEGKTLGLIGMGRIGQEAAKIAIGIGMHVVAFDPFVEQVELTFGTPQFNGKALLKKSSLDEVLAAADFITLHVPGLAKPILSTEEFSKVKKGAILINCARGGVVNEDAMLEALNNGTLAAAGVDVFENEPNPRKDILSHPNVSLTPHIGAATMEAQEKVGGELASQIIALLG
jgi:D-3-phosphoglycerate dehydrogenase / 2-oxoglutarate reductase